MSGSSPIVYVVQNQHRQDANGVLVPKFDLERARPFGDLSFLLSPTARPFNTESILDDLHHKLAKYRPDTDHLLLLGNPVLIGLSVAVAAHYGGGNVRMLQWDGKRQSYVPIVASGVL